MNIYRISLTITTFLSTSHPSYHCFLYTETPHGHESKSIDINAANQLMWKLKSKGWHTKATAEYSCLSPRIYDRHIEWMKIEDGYKED